MSIGSELKDARESRKITLETVSKKTKIPTKYLEAIEENRFDVFPSQTYAKGFIRAYAKVVGVDPFVLTRQFSAEVNPEEMRIEPKNAEAELERNLGWRPTLSRPPVFRRQDAPGDLNLEMADAELPEPIQYEPSVMRRRALIFKKGKVFQWLGQAAALFLAVAVIVGVLYLGRKAVSKIKWGSPKTETNSGDSNGYEPVKVVDKYQHLVLKALDKSWVLVTMDDGQSSSEADMDQGEVKTYQAVKNFTLKLGNAGGVDVQFNGKPLGILGVTGQVVEIQLPPVEGSEAKDKNGDS